MRRPKNRQPLKPLWMKLQQGHSRNWVKPYVPTCNLFITSLNDHCNWRFALTLHYAKLIYTRQLMYYNVTQARSRNHFCRGKAKSITSFVCVCVSGCVQIGDSVRVCVRACVAGGLRVRFTLEEAIYWVGCLTPRSGRFTPERQGTHCIEGWVGSRAGMDGCGKPRRHR